MPKDSRDTLTPDELKALKALGHTGDTIGSCGHLIREGTHGGHYPQLANMLDTPCPICVENAKSSASAKSAATAAPSAKGAAPAAESPPKAA